MLLSKATYDSLTTLTIPRFTAMLKCTMVTANGSTFVGSNPQPFDYQPVFLTIRLKIWAFVFSYSPNLLVPSQICLTARKYAKSYVPPQYTYTDKVRKYETRGVRLPVCQSRPKQDATHSNASYQRRLRMFDCLIALIPILEISSGHP